MPKNDKITVFMIDYGLKGWSRYCEHDNDYVMRFERKDGTKVEFHSSRNEVAERYGFESKDESVAHFERMGMEWYAKRNPKVCQEDK